MALQKDTPHKGYTANYWAIGPQIHDPLQRTLVVDMVLYKDSATYDSDPIGNALITYPEKFIIKGSDYDSVFETTNTVTQMLMAIFAVIKAQVDLDGNPGYFADAEIIP